MSESDPPESGHNPKAGRILALHAAHREGLHSVPAVDCIQCEFDSLMRPPADEPTKVMPDPEMS